MTRSPEPHWLGGAGLQVNRPTAEVTVTNVGDRPIQVGSHYHFFEVNRNLRFDRELSFGMHLDIPAGTAVRFEPGEEREVELVAMGGDRTVFGLNGLTNGPAGDEHRDGAMQRARERGFVADMEG